MKFCRNNFLKFCPSNKTFTSLLAVKAVQLGTPFFWDAAQSQGVQTRSNRTQYPRKMEFSPNLVFTKMLDVIKQLKR
jgi:hypothetical protein